MVKKLSEMTAGRDERHVAWLEQPMGFGGYRTVATSPRLAYIPTYRDKR